jgi:hypothetical protein
VGRIGLLPSAPVVASVQFVHASRWVNRAAVGFCRITAEC